MPFQVLIFRKIGDTAVTTQETDDFFETVPQCLVILVTAPNAEAVPTFFPLIDDDPVNAGNISIQPQFKLKEREVVDHSPQTRVLSIFDAFNDLDLSTSIQEWSLWCRCGAA